MTETSTVLIVFNSVLAYTITISSRIRNQKADILDSDCQCNLTAQIELVQDKLIYFVLSDKNLHGSVLLQVITITGADPGGGPKIGKKYDFFVQIRDFSHEIPQQISSLAPLSAIILSAPPNLKSCIRPWIKGH